MTGRDGSTPLVGSHQSTSCYLSLSLVIHARIMMDVRVRRFMEPEIERDK